MRKPLLVSALLLTSALAYAATSATQPLSGCAGKRQAISEQLDIAKRHGNSNQQAGLEKALKAVDDNCNDADLRAEREAKVVNAIEDVDEREKDLREALADGDQDDINKRQDKLQASRAKLQQARDALGQ
ncbi:DUF1090 domain-containing protein [uncultured Pseudomonas sp.]|uniref:DUF1090 domain-containing protein n=1 Tax=uncultured Pseudomonas sp. TaxID=114707 RepID=UPI002618AEE8|nr:DUF1090 domain-containing protein [uncultured Pseudomonas sp.]